MYASKDAGDTSDTLGESQASQLLRDVMDETEPRPAINDASQLNNATRDYASSDSPNSSRTSHSDPQYHFHGLATTQTQSQYTEEDYIPAESSQEETVDALGKQKMEVTPKAGASCLSKNISEKASRVRRMSPSPSRPDPKRAKLSHTKAVDFQSTRSTPSRTKKPTSRSKPLPSSPVHSRYTPRPPVDPQASQDSFAGGISQDPGQQYLARATQFDVPLSELARVAEEGSQFDDSESTNLQNSSMYNQSVARTPMSGPTTFVEATPSNSETSQSEGHATQPQSGEPLDPDLVSCRQPTGFEDIPAREGEGDGDHSQPSDVSSSYERFLNGESEPSRSPAAEATQLVDSDADTTEAGPSNATTSSTTHSRSMYSLIANPLRRKKYEQAGLLGLPLAHLTPTPEEPNYQETQPTNEDEHYTVDRHQSEALQETQPSNENEPPPLNRYQRAAALHGHSRGNGNGISHAAPSEALQEAQPPHEDENPHVNRNPRQALRAPMAAPPVPREFEPRGLVLEPTQPSFEDESVPRRQLGRAQTTNPPSSVIKSADHRDTGQNREPVGNDTMEVVPDSEPLRADRTPSPSRALRGTTRSPTKSVRAAKAVRQPDPASDLEDIVPDSAIMEEEDEDEEKEGEEDEDVPLAILTSKHHRTDAKGKEKVPPVPPRSAVAKGKQKEADVVLDTDTTPNDLHKRPYIRNTKLQSKTRESDVVPSSVPDQDVIKPPPRTTRARASKSTKTPARKTTRTVGKSKSAAKKRLLDSVETIPDDDEALQMLKEEELTELADDDFREDFEGVAGPSTRKSKRGGRSRQASKSSTITRKTRSGSTIVDLDSATRVFALWKQDGQYYPGLIYAHKPGNKFLVRFDDHTQGVVELDQMRSLVLKVGDDILNEQCRRATVTASNLAESDLIRIDLDGVSTNIELSEVRIASKTITHAWDNRKLNPADISTAEKPLLKPESTATSLRTLPSDAGSAKSIRQGFLSKTGLIVTLSVGTEDWEKEKQRLMRAIQHSGGTVVDGWSAVLSLDGKHSRKRWVIEKKDVKWKGGAGIERILLLADDYNQKPKYLIALALGVPCISVKWLEDSMPGDEKDWNGYLLPQGYVDHLRVRISQSVDMDWGNSPYYLNDLMDNHVASKLFDNLSILCLGSEFVPLAVPTRARAGSEDKQNDASRDVPRIVLCMGAARVEAASDLSYASSSPDGFDYVLIKNETDFRPELTSNTIVWSWVKQCLIAGRLLPRTQFTKS